MKTFEHYKPNAFKSINVSSKYILDCFKRIYLRIGLIVQENIVLSLQETCLR